jgi:hypothetical protein
MLWLTCRVGGTAHRYTVCDRIFGDFPAQNIVYIPFMYSSGQPYSFGISSIETRLFFTGMLTALVHV